MLIFVYGTLKQGFPNFGVNRGVRAPGRFATLLRLPLVLVGERCTPWLVWQPGQGFSVSGQLFHVDDAALEAMDALERVDAADGYRRRTLLVRAIDAPAAADASDGTSAAPLEAQAYVKPPEHLRGQAIHSGPHADYTTELAALYRPRA